MNGREFASSPLGQQLGGSLITIGAELFVGWLRRRHADPSGLTNEQILAEFHEFERLSVPAMERLRQHGIEPEDLEPAEPAPV